jgi:small-conductance mechanosensitive channel
MPLVDPNAPNYKPKDYRMLAIGLCVAAVVLFGYASFSNRWLENTQSERTSIGFSLIGFEVCHTGHQHSTDCTAVSNFALVRALKAGASRHDEPPSGMFAPAGVATMALSLLAVLALGATAYFVWKRRRLAWKVLPNAIALLAIMAALIAACLFVAKKPGGYAAVGVGPSFWAFAIACVVGIAGAQMVNKYIKPIDPDLGPSSSGNAL